MHEVPLDFRISNCGRDKFLGLADGGGGQFSVHTPGFFKQGFQFGERFFRSGEGLLASSEFLVREIAGEGGAGSADA